MKKLLPKWLILGFILVSFLGFLDASYLTINHYSGTTPDCTLIAGCGEVTTSKYATILNIPVALLGMFYYLTVLITSLLYFDTKNSKIIRIFLPLTSVGFLASAWFVAAQIFIIKSICQYCMLSALTSTILFIFGLLTLKYYGKKETN